MRALRFENTFFDTLPGSKGPTQPSRATPGVLWVETPPSPASNPQLLIASPETGALLDLTEADFHSLEFARVFSGSALPPKCRPIATRYGGHQFGHWAGQLGDGRAILLGELVNQQHERFEIQLKGAGQTPYSRNADGRAVLRSSLREFLCSEAMHHLGIPTTRALSCVLTGDSVIRDMLYDGNPEPEPGAITTRVAPSFLRLGHFQLLSSQGETDLLRTLVSQTITRFFPGIPSTEREPLSEETLTTWFTEVSTRTALLMAHWIRVHFVHGVMNTDNLSILGLTIDYGPYGWLDTFDPDWTPNTTDSSHRRYRFGNQPSIALWNLARFAESLLPLYESPERGKERLQGGLQAFQKAFQEHYLEFSLAKLGLSRVPPTQSIPLLERLDALLRKEEMDPTLFCRALASIPAQTSRLSQEITPALEIVRSALLNPAHLNDSLAQSWQEWFLDYGQALRVDGRSPADQEAEMNRSNPVFILRNYLVQEALDALANGDRTVLDRLMVALRTPYEANSATLPFFKKRPEWARTRAGCAALSCSS